MAEHDLGHVDESSHVLASFANAHANDSAYLIGVAYGWCEDRDQAFIWLNRAIAQHDENVQYVKYDPLLGPLRNDPRYAELLRKLKLPE